ncbi:MULTISPECIES: CBS domain-containing protein [Metallosphaera]|uniref:Histidine kinase n=3 Tax=Metallosphaera TaxID=41980 RepID=A0A088E346_9CREN|nr:MULTISPECIES: CBS domain-containing protein [Metallosphaera]ABP94416.1 putative signal transduction protein with CBS domains [Metallosphaera sedula DSM 5348]AIM26403.1 putative signal transduction protein with CBS domains [Metallosphaera sedula]AKV73405.1 histidine kinase [Metallosphaera sedula]AKV75649.1 histidine kinase [Metallosphaera sedula]AKV77895.1 histidine kinase [Metallosphaera sedula]
MEEIVKDYMKTEVISVEKGATLRQITKIMTEKNVGSVIITENGKPIGIVTERDVVRAIGKDHKLDDKVDDIMTVSLITVREDSPITGALSLMRTYNIRHLPVISEDGKLTGIISIRDVAKALDDMFES